MTSLDREEVQKPISSFEDMFLNIITTAVENAIANTVGPRLEAVETRLDSLEGRLDRIEGRLDSLEGRLTEVHESLADQITKQGQAINRRFDAMGTRSE